MISELITSPPAPRRTPKTSKVDSERLLRFPEAFFVVPLKFVLLFGGQSGEINVDLANEKLFSQLTRVFEIRLRSFFLSFKITV